jgi:hypothetical protein
MQNIGACGLNCGNCEAYNATQANDLKKLAELAKSWGGANNWSLEQMRCDGCTSNHLQPGCRKCAVRTCAQKGAEVCSRCGEYPCDKLMGLWKSLHGDVESWKANLEKAK